MSTPTLNLSFPYENIFRTTPHYSKLKIFGCLYYHWLQSYTNHKLESCSKPCIFLGYSLTQSAYHCLDPSTSKICLSPCPVCWIFVSFHPFLTTVTSSPIHYYCHLVSPTNLCHLTISLTTTQFTICSSCSLAVT